MDLLSRAESLSPMERATRSKFWCDSQALNRKADQALDNESLGNFVEVELKLKVSLAEGLRACSDRACPQ
jgi:hypothetical protein